MALSLPADLGIDGDVVVVSHAGVIRLFAVTVVVDAQFGLPGASAVEEGVVDIPAGKARPAPVGEGRLLLLCLLPGQSRPPGQAVRQEPVLLDLDAPGPEFGHVAVPVVTPIRRVPVVPLDLVVHGEVEEGRRPGLVSVVPSLEAQFVAPSLFRPQARIGRAEGIGDLEEAGHGEKAPRRQVPEVAVFGLIAEGGLGDPFLLVVGVVDVPGLVAQPQVDHHLSPEEGEFGEGSHVGPLPFKEVEGPLFAAEGHAPGQRVLAQGGAAAHLKPPGPIFQGRRPPVVDEFLLLVVPVAPDVAPGGPVGEGIALVVVGLAVAAALDEGDRPVGVEVVVGVFPLRTVVAPFAAEEPAPPGEPDAAAVAVEVEVPVLGDGTGQAPHLGQGGGAFLLMAVPERGAHPLAGHGGPGGPAAPVVGPRLGENAVIAFRQRFAGDDVDDAGGGMRAVEGRSRPLDDLDALDRFEGDGAQVIGRSPFDVGGLVVGDAVDEEEDLRRQAPDAERVVGGSARRTGRMNAGQGLKQLSQREGTAAFDGLPFDDVGRSGHLLKAFGQT